MKDLIGKKVRGFKFEGDYYPATMDEYIGVIGKIVDVCKKYKTATVNFNNDGYYWDYPLDQIEQHLVKEEPTTEEILKMVYDKWGFDVLDVLIDNTPIKDLDTLGFGESFVIEQLINKWYPKKYLSIINNEISITREQTSISVEVTDEVKKQLKELI